MRERFSLVIWNLCTFVMVIVRSRLCCPLLNCGICRCEPCMQMPHFLPMSSGQKFESSSSIIVRATTSQDFGIRTLSLGQMDHTLHGSVPRKCMVSHVSGTLGQKCEGGKHSPAGWRMSKHSWQFLSEDAAGCLPRVPCVCVTCACQNHPHFCSSICLTCAWWYHPHACSCRDAVLPMDVVRVRMHLASLYEEYTNNTDVARDHLVHALQAIQQHHCPSRKAGAIR